MLKTQMLRQFIVAVGIVVVWGLVARAQGVVLPGVGPVNRSMAGATVGAPIDAAGAMHWNPAGIAALGRSEMMFGAEFLHPRTEVSSTVPGFGAGADDSDSGVAVLPSSAIVYHPDDSRYTWGFGVYTIGGFGANFPANPANPIFSPPPPAGAGVGAVYSELALIQFAPTAATWITDHLAIGFAPTFTMADLGVDPAFFAPPDDADGNASATYPSATHARFHWAVGFQIGLYYETEGPWSYGVSFKSPQWFETFQFNSTDEIGNPRQLELDIDYPMILSGGIGYRPSDQFLWATDIRYINYADTQGFGHNAAFAPNGSVTGLGWESVMSVSSGIQYQFNPCTSFRAGYLYNENPIPDAVTFFNIASSPIYQHAAFVGATRHLTDALALSACYLHAFENSIQGPFQTPIGPIPGASVGVDQVTDALTVAIHLFF